METDTLEAARSQAVLEKMFRSQTADDALTPRHRNMSGKRMTDEHDPRFLAELSASIESAQQAFQRVADAAFSRLEVADPDLVEALLDLFERRQAAASYLARIQFDDEPNAYAALAAGKRDRILELIARVKNGFL